MDLNSETILTHLILDFDLWTNASADLCTFHTVDSDSTHTYYIYIYIYMYHFAFHFLFYAMSNNNFFNSCTYSHPVCLYYNRPCTIYQNHTSKLWQYHVLLKNKTHLLKGNSHVTKDCQKGPTNFRVSDDGTPQCGDTSSILPVGEK